MEHQEELRQQYRPSEVRVPFVGESPPANGTFFYREDSNLWRYTLQAFSNVYGSDCLGEDTFLSFFKSKGCYLEDLCSCPVNGLPRVERRRACEATVGSLASRISPLSPKAVVCVKMSIARHVKSAMAVAGLQAVPLHKLPFPSYGHQPEYVGRLASLIGELRTDRVLV